MNLLFWFRVKITTYESSSDTQVIVLTVYSLIFQLVQQTDEIKSSLIQLVDHML